MKNIIFLFVFMSLLAVVGFWASGALTFMLRSVRVRGRRDGQRTQ